jgi:hypothetical protein
MTKPVNVDSDIFDALFTHLELNQVLTPPLRCAAPLVKFNPVGKETYFRASFLPNQTQSPHVGAGTDLHTGIFQVMVAFPTTNEGLVGPLDLAGSLVTQFAKGLTLRTTSGIVVKINRSPWMAPVLIDGARSGIPVSIPYEATVTS